jgi:hypothetical protein
MTRIANGVLLEAENSDTYIIPNYVKEVMDWAFWDFHKTTHIVIPSSVEKIGCVAFWGCRNLAQITIKGKERKVIRADDYQTLVYSERVIDGIKVYGGRYLKFHNACISGTPHFLAETEIYGEKFFARSDISAAGAVRNLKFELQKDNSFEKYSGLSLSSRIDLNTGAEFYRNGMSVSSADTEKFLIKKLLINAKTGISKQDNFSVKEILCLVNDSHLLSEWNRTHPKETLKTMNNCRYCKPSVKDACDTLVKRRTR